MVNKPYRDLYHESMRWYRRAEYVAGSRGDTIKRLLAENAELRRRLDDANGIAHEAAELSVDAMESNRELRRENADLRRRVEEQQSVIDKLPKTADGVPVVPGEDCVWHPSIVDRLGQIQPMALDIDCGAAWWRMPNQRLPISRCYSTKESAERREGT